MKERGKYGKRDFTPLKHPRGGGINVEECQSLKFPEGWGEGDCFATLAMTAGKRDGANYRDKPRMMRGWHGWE
jgi:hypothetical protein